MPSRNPERQASAHDREYPVRPVASVHAAIVEGGQILMVKRAGPPSQGRWSLPGGVIELGETLTDAVRREVLEECGIEIEPGRVLDVADAIVHDAPGRIRFHYVVAYVLARRIAGQPRAASDAADVRWVRRDDLDGLDMHPRVRAAAGQALAHPF